MSIQATALKRSKQAEFALRKHAPTILTGLGVAGFVATTALTIRATTKAVDIFPKISRDVANAKDPVFTANMDDKEKSKELAKAYVENGLELAKIYGPALLVGSASIVCIISAHGMMLKRQASLLAAYSALDASYRAYRRRVAEQIGEDKELELYRRPNMRALDGDEGEIDQCQIDFVNEIMPSPYARFFDETSRSWTKTPEYNLMFLRAQQDWANDRLKAHGFIFLNEVYEALGLERSQAGQLVGWKQQKNEDIVDGSASGDGFVDFGLYAIGDECNRAFVNGIEHTVLLDFNVDGVIKI